MGNALSGGRYYPVNGFNMGVSGENSTQILARIPNALALNPAVLVIEAGTNDPFDDLAVTGPNLTSMYEQTLAAGCRAVAITRFPDVSNQEPATVNNFIRSYPGINVADCTPGFINSVMTNDGTHPNSVGAVFVGGIAAAVLASLTSPASILNVTAGQLLPNPTMSGSVTPPAVGSNVVGTGVIPTGFQLYENNGTSFTTSMVGSQDTSPIGANEQIITITNGAGGTATVIFNYPSIAINAQLGDTFETWCDVNVVQSSGLQQITLYFGSSYLGPGGTIPSLQTVDSVYRTSPVPFSGSLARDQWQMTFSLLPSASCQVKVSSIMARKVPIGQ